MLQRFVLLSFLVASSASANNFSGAVLNLHGWQWQAITDHLGEIRDAGYTAIQLSPHERGVGGVYSEGYDPGDYTSFDSHYGDESQLYWLIKTAHHFQIEVYADLVMNHMGTGGNYEYARFGWNDFHHNGDIANWDDQWWMENGDLYGLNDLCHECDHVRSELYDFIVKTNNMGFDGYRLDAAKHVPIWYWRDDVLPSLNGWGKFTYGEVFSSLPWVLDAYSSAGMAVTDYQLQFALRDAFHYQGDLRILDHAGYAADHGSQSLTFVENHDVGPPQNRMMAYAFIAAYPGYPMFANFDLNDRDANNLVWIHNHFAYGSTLTRYVDHDTIVFEREGHLLAAFNQSGQGHSIWVETSWPHTTLHDYTGFTGDTTTDGSGWVEVNLPATGYAMLAPR